MADLKISPSLRKRIVGTVVKSPRTPQEVLRLVNARRGRRKAATIAQITSVLSDMLLAGSATPAMAVCASGTVTKKAKASVDLAKRVLREEKRRARRRRQGK